MTIQTLLPSPWQRFCDNNGNPAVGYLVYTYQSGTTTPAVTYTDFTGTQQNLNPIVLDFRGECSIWGPPNTAYTYVFTFPNDTNPPSNPIKTVNGIQNGLSLTQGIIGSALYPQTQAELNAGITPVNYGYPPMNVLRYGIVPNQSGPPYIGNNTLYATQLFQPTITNGPTGKFIFPNTTGSDIYYFNDLVALRDYTAIDLNNCNWALVKGTATGNEASAGALIGIRGISIENGTVSVNFTGGETACITFGARGSEAGGGAFFPNTYDQGLPVPQGYCTARNLTLTSNSPSGYGMTLTGGMRNVDISDIEIEGNGVLAGGIYYEYGFATNGGGLGSGRLSSHMYNASIKNIDMEGITGGEGTGLSLIGSYNHTVENIYVNGAITAMFLSSGESMYYQPWAQDLTGKKCTKTHTNIVGENLTGAGIILQGTALASNTYLGSGPPNGPVVVGNPPLTQLQVWAAEKNLGIFSVNGFALSGGGSGTGVLTSGTSVDIRNGACSGFASGMGSYDESGIIIAENIIAAGCQNSGFNFALGNNNTDSPNWSGTGTISGPTLTIASTISGALAIGDPILGQGVAPGSYLTAGSGTSWTIFPSQTLSTTTNLFSCYATKKIYARGLVAVNNSQSSAGAYPGIQISNCDSADIQGRFNAETIYDGANETTQGNAVQLGANAQNVRCTNVRTGFMIGSNVAYSNVTNIPGFSNGNTVISPSGTATYKGSWLNLLTGTSADRGDTATNFTLTVGSDYQVQLFATTFTQNHTVTLNTLNAVNGSQFVIMRTGLGSFTLIVNSTYTFASGVGGWVRMLFNGTAWVEMESGTF